MFDHFDTTVTCEEFYIGTPSIDDTCPYCGTDHGTLAQALACGEEPFDANVDTNTYDDVTEEPIYPW